MGKKKLKNPFQIGKKRTPAQARIVLESQNALEVYNARMQTRKAIATEQEMIDEYSNRDAWMESWMYGCLAIVLHRRYRLRAPKITEILNEIQALHNEIVCNNPDCETYEDVNRIVAQRVMDEVGMKVFDDNVLAHNT